MPYESPWQPLARVHGFRLNADGSLHGFRLNADGSLHGSVKCVDCGVRAKHRKLGVRLNPIGQPLCGHCHDSRTSRQAK